MKADPDSSWFSLQGRSMRSHVLRFWALNFFLRLAVAIKGAASWAAKVSSGDLLIVLLLHRVASV